MLFAGEPRTWKWLVPALLVPILLAAAFWSGQSEDPFWWTFSCLFGIWALILTGMAVKMFLSYYRKLDADYFERIQHARAVTADSVRLEAAKGVHPRVFELLMGERARRWEMVNGTQSADGRPYRVLHAAPIVTEAFFVHFLKKSTRTSYMSKRLLSDKAKAWDPNGIVSAYEMYEAVEKMLADELKVVRPYGKHGKGMWLPDWEPESVALDFDIDLEAWTYNLPRLEDDKVEVKDGMQQVHRPAETEQEAAWVANTLQKTTAGWDPHNPKSALASELEDEE